MKHGEVTLGQLEALLNKIGGIQGMKQILSDNFVVSLIPKTWKVWRTITLGVDSKTNLGLCEKVTSSGVKVSEWIKTFIEKNPCSTANTTTKVELAMVSLADLGLTTHVTYEEMYKRAIELGLQFCTMEIILELRSQYTDQPKKTRFLVASELLEDGDGSFATFHLMNGNGELSLDVFFIKPYVSFCQLDEEFIFVKSSKIVSV